MATIEKVATYEAPGQPGSPVELKPRYDNFVGETREIAEANARREPATRQRAVGITTAPMATLDDVVEALTTQGQR